MSGPYNALKAYSPSAAPRTEEQAPAPTAQPKAEQANDKTNDIQPAPPNPAQPDKTPEQKADHAPQIGHVARFNAYDNPFAQSAPNAHANHAPASPKPQQHMQLGA